MALLKSLGLREPSGLSYLIAEGILSPDPPQSTYSWRINLIKNLDGQGAVEEEVLHTQHCVVLSVAGVVKRVYNTQIEGEDIIQAFTTQFPTGQDVKNENSSGETLQAFERGLVVVLKSKAHIFLHTGDSYMVPLPSEVERAFASPRGFILQCKSRNDVDARHNGSSTGLGPSLTRSVPAASHPTSTPTIVLDTRTETVQLKPRPSKPTTYYLTGVMSELGIVVLSDDTSHVNDAAGEVQASLSEKQRIIHVTSKDEYDVLQGLEDISCDLVVTFNELKSALNIWQMTFNASDDIDSGPSDETGRSFVGHRFETKRPIISDSIAQPVASTVQTTGLRESFGDPKQVQTEENQQSFGQRLTQIEEIENQLGAEFGASGVQTRSGRRVSSMIARTDLAMGHDRSTFSEIPVGTMGRKSLNRSGHRGESTGSVIDQHSVGARRRSSFPAPSSIASTRASFLTAPPHQSLGGFDPIYGANDHEFNFDLESGNMSKDVELRWVKSIPVGVPHTASTDALQRFKAFTMPHPREDASMDGENRKRCVCLVDRYLHQLMLAVISPRSSVAVRRRHNHPHRIPRLKVSNVYREVNVQDACLLWQEKICRLMVLRALGGSNTSLSLESPWAASVRLTLPPRLFFFDPLGTPDRPNRAHGATGSKRVFGSAGLPVTGIDITGVSTVVLKDAEANRHRLHVQLHPKSSIVVDILNLSDLILPNKNESLWSAYWEIVNWLSESDTHYENMEWTAIVVVLFSLVVPFLSEKANKLSTTPSKKATARNSSGTMQNTASWDKMHDLMSTSGKTAAHCWSWTNGTLSQQMRKQSAGSPSHSRRTSNVTEQTSLKKDLRLLKWIALAREFCQTPVGEAAIGVEGYLPTAMNQDREARQNAIPSLLVGLHVLREESKLDARREGSSDGNSNMAIILPQLGHWLGWQDWSWHETGFYYQEHPSLSQIAFDDSTITGLACPGQPYPPPSLFAYVEEGLQSANSNHFPTLFDLLSSRSDGQCPTSTYRDIVKLTPRSIVLLCMFDSVGFSQLPLSGTQCKQLLTQIHRYTKPDLSSSLPDAIATILQQVVNSDKNTFGDASLVKDLVPGSNGRRSSEPNTSRVNRLRLSPLASHDATRDLRAINSLALEADSVHVWDSTVNSDHQTVSRMIFSQDRRLQEASKLLNQTRPPLVGIDPQEGWSEAELLDAQKDLVQHVTRRTLSVAAGRGMMHFNVRVPLLTERVPIPAFSLQCVMRPRHSSESSQIMTFSADKAAFTEDRICWAFFHNGASAGLNVSRQAKGIDTSWILYNKPTELTNRHAGFLLALGLNGHLKSLAKWVAFKYLTPKHTMTSIGLLLGLSGSYLGTMDTMITRMLSVHVTRLLPRGAAELNLNGLTQTSGIMGVGLVYLDSGHRGMSEVMVSEIENMEADEVTGGVPPTGNMSSEDSILRDEGYRLAAGFSLGLINLGRGHKLDSLRDMSILERLLTVAVGTKDVDYVNVLDRATAGAVVAIALIWLKTGDERVAEKIDIPDTIHQFDYVRPDIFLLRTLARHLILWGRIQATKDFIRDSLPLPYRQRASLKTIKYLRSEDMPFFSIVAGVCFAIGLRFAGTLSHSVRDLLIDYLDQFMRLSRLSAENYDAKLTQNSIRNCQDIVALSVAIAMAGSGDMIVLRRLRSLHGRTDAETPYGSHLAAHMAIGALFLGCGTSTFGTSNLAVASLLISFYPIFPRTVLDNKAHLQALRHLWVLAVQHRCLVMRDSENGKPITGEAIITMMKGEKRRLSTPGILPELEEVFSITSSVPNYYETELNLGDEATRSRLQSEASIYLKRRPAYDRDVSETFMAELEAIEEASDLPSASLGSSMLGSKKDPANKSSLEWLWSLESFRNFDYAEHALVLPSGDSSLLPEQFLAGSVVDSRLELERTILPEAGRTVVNHNGLWQLRLLLSWVDYLDQEEQAKEKSGMDHDAVHMDFDSTPDTQLEQRKSDEGRLRREVIERLRWRIWQMSGEDATNSAGSG